MGKQWSSTSITSDTESYLETHVIKSAPPVIDDKSIWEPIPKEYTAKSPLQRTEAVNWAAPPARKFRWVAITQYNYIKFIVVLNYC